MAWSIGTSWLKQGRRRAPPPLAPLPRESRMVAELRETALAWKAKLAETAAGQSPAALLGPSLDQLDHDLSRKPRVAILGEFNAGKTTLSNLLARAAGLPTDILANTRVATLIHHADLGPERILVPQRRRSTPGDGPSVRIAEAPFEYELLAGRAGLLERCTLLDTPGLSDPTHAGRVADLYARIADIAVWCSIAGHCWRESERLAWDSFPARLRRYGILVLTGADAVPRASDRDRIRRRLERDAAGRFGAVVFLAGREAAAALDVRTGEITSQSRWEASGAAELESVLAGLVGHVADQRALRSRRWAARLLRQVATFPHAEIGRSWWLPPLFALSEDLRRISVALRGRRMERRQALAQVAAGVVKLQDDIVGKLERLGRSDDARRVQAVLSRNLETIDALGRTVTHTAVVDGVGIVGARLFHDITQLMRGADRETATLRELEIRLLDMLGSTKGGAIAPGR